MLECAFFHTRNATADPTMTMIAALNMTHPTISPANIPAGIGAGSCVGEAVVYMQTHLHT